MPLTLLQYVNYFRDICDDDFEEVLKVPNLDGLLDSDAIAVVEAYMIPVYTVLTSRRKDTMVISMAHVLRLHKLADNANESIAHLIQPIRAFVDSCVEDPIFHNFISPLDATVQPMFRDSVGSFFDVKYEFRHNGVCQTQGLVSFDCPVMDGSGGYDDMAGRIKPPDSWQGLSYYHYGLRFQSTGRYDLMWEWQPGWQILLLMGGTTFSFALTDVDNANGFPMFIHEPISFMFDSAVVEMRLRIYGALVDDSSNDGYDYVSAKRRYIDIDVLLYDSVDDYNEASDDERYDNYRLKPRQAFHYIKRILARNRWQRVKKWLHARYISLYWNECTAHLMAEGGSAHKRDRDEFEAQCKDLVGH